MAEELEDKYGRPFEDMSLPVQERCKQRYMNGEGKRRTVMNGYEYVQEIEKQIKELEKKKIEPQIICIRSYGWMVLKHLVNDSDKAIGKVIKLGDSGHSKLFYKDILVLNISHANEETTINIDELNWVKVYGN